MKTFSLTIGTPDGMIYQGKIESIRCRSICGDVMILSGHSNYCTALGEGEAAVVFPNGERKCARCSGGMLSVINGICHVLSKTWRWVE